MTPRRLLLVLLVLGFAILPLSAADPTLMRLVPPDSTVVGGVNMEQARGTPFGQFLLKQLQTEDGDLQKLMEATGFDPRRDLREVLIASANTKGAKHDKGLVAASGSFDPARIAAAAKEHGAALTNYAGVDVLTSGKEANDGWLALLSSSIAVAGNADQVRAAIDRYKGSGSGPGAGLTAKAVEWSGKTDAWLVSSVSPADLTRHVPAAPAEGPLKGVSLDSIEQTAGGVKFGMVVKVSVEAIARTDKDANALADVIRFLAGMVQMNRDNPDTAQVAALLDTMELTIESRTLRLALSVPEDQLEKMFETHHGGPAKRPAARKRATI